MATGTRSSGTTAAELVAAADPHSVGLSPAEVWEELSRGTVLVDLREEDELRTSGWIPNSVWAPRGMLEFWADPEDRRHRVEFDPRRRLILYCSTGERSSLAAAALRSMGYGDLGRLQGGIEAWKREGLPVEKP